jgi:hypothetical protein
MATCLIEEKPYCAVEATTVPRWGAYVREYNDNTSFYTQCNALDRQITAIIANLQKKYNNPRIHLCFVCESFGGKIGLFFLSKNLKRYQSQKVSIDNFITVHSPLYGMTLAKYMVDKRESMMKLWSNKAFGLLVTAIQYDFLNVLNVDYYWETFKLLSESQIDRVTTDQALGNLIAHRVKILNFIGTPNDIVFSGLKPSYSVIIKILKALTNHFFDVDASGKDVFKTAQWDTFDHSLRSISGIILELKQTGIFNMLVENFAGQRNPLLKTIQQCQDDIQLEVVLRELLSQYDFNEQIFLDTNFVEAIRLLSGLLRDITNLLEKDVYNSDVVVGVEEITKNPVLIKEIENSRTKPFIFGEYPEQVFIVTPNIYHVCDHAAMPEFNQDLRMFFNPLFMRTLA